MILIKKFILLENPVLCADNLPELVGAMEMRFARLIGVAHCIVPQQIVDPSLHMQPPLTLQKMMKPQSIGVSPILQPMEPPPSIVQIIVPAALIQETKPNVTIETPKQETVEAANDTITDAPETHSNQTVLQEATTESHVHVQKEENDTTHTHESESPVDPPAVVQDLPAEKSVDDDTEIDEMPETDPIQEFNKIHSPDAYPPISLPEILHEVLPQPQRTHASLEAESEPDEIPAQKDEALQIQVEEQPHSTEEEEDDDDLLQETLADLAETPS